MKKYGILAEKKAGKFVVYLVMQCIIDSPIRCKQYNQSSSNNIYRIKISHLSTFLYHTIS
jgi:hypothetical protein